MDIRPIRSKLDIDRIDSITKKDRVTINFYIEELPTMQQQSSNLTFTYTAA
jgi:hypothetical protein